VNPGRGRSIAVPGWENPLPPSEDLATVEILSGGRINPGLSIGPPVRFADVRDALYPDTAVQPHTPGLADRIW